MVLPDAGERFLAEIREQPRAIRALLEYEAEIAGVAHTARPRGASIVRMVGHGRDEPAQPGHS